MKKEKNPWSLGILPSGRPLQVNCKERGIGGRVGPRTGASERIVLVHCSDTRRVAFVVGNSCSNRSCRI